MAAKGIKNTGTHHPVARADSGRSDFNGTRSQSAELSTGDGSILWEKSSTPHSKESRHLRNRQRSTSYSAHGTSR